MTEIWSAKQFQEYAAKEGVSLKTKKNYSEQMWRELNEVCDGWVREYKFCPTRKWRADFALIDKKIICEFEGIFSNQSRHTNRVGYSRDCVKYTEATILGWSVMRYTAMTISNLKKDIERLIESKK